MWGLTIMFAALMAHPNTREKRAIRRDPEFRREVQHPSALSLLDFPFLGAAFASRNAAEGGGEEGKSELSLVSPSVPRCCTSRQNRPDSIY